MRNDLHQALHDTTAELTLDRPVSDIVARGDQIRRRRRRSLTVGAAAGVLAGAAALSLALPQGSSPLVPSAQAAWGPDAINLSAAELAPADEACREEFDPRIGGDDVPRWTFPAGVQPIAADERAGLVELIYVHDGVIGECSLVRHGGGYEATGSSLDELQPLRPGIPLGFVTMTYSSGTVDGPVTDGVGVLQASADVARVEVTIGDTTVEAAVHEGFVFFWLPDGHTQQELDDATIAAFDSAGGALELGSTELTNQPPVPADGGSSITDEAEGRF